MIKRILQEIKRNSAPTFFNGTLWTLGIGLVIVVFAAYTHTYMVELSYDTSKIILSTLIAAASSFIGFFVVYLTISFENFKKNYGQYALELFRKDKGIWGLGYLFVIIIISGITAFIFSDTKSFFSNVLFNIACFYFIVGIGSSILIGRVIINKSSSTEFLKELIDGLNNQDFNYNEPQNPHLRTIFQIVNRNEKNKVSIVSDILFYNIVSSNSRNGVQIIIALFDKIKKIIEHENLDNEKNRQIIFSFLDILQTSFDLYNSKKDFIGIQTNLAALNSCNEIIAKRKYDRRFIKRVFEAIEYIILALMESEWERLVTESLWVYYHMSADQLTYNMPDERETWMADEYFGAVTIDTKIAEENDDKFESIDEFISFRFNALIERSFLCKNSYIIEECVGMLGIFTEMIVFNDNMGELQKDRIGSSLAYSSEEAIKRYISTNRLNRSTYLQLFMGTSIILNGLEQNSRFSKSIFDTLINIFEFLMEKNIVEKSDIQKISGLCRLVIANSSKITDANKYVEDILKVQKKLKTKMSKELLSDHAESRSRYLREMIGQIQNDIKSYKSLMGMRNIVNKDLEEIIAKYM